MNKLAIITGIVTIIIFTLEACFTYNLGKYKINKINRENIELMCIPPPFIELIKILCTIFVFYTISALIVYMLSKYIKD
jgi:hypothetical protein